MARGRGEPISAQQIDPLSWFTGPYVPLVFGGLIVLYGGFGTATVIDEPWRAGLQLLAMALFAAGEVLVYVTARSLRNSIRWPVGALAMAFAAAAVICSAVGVAGEHDGLIERWWAPVAAALMLGSLGPYLAARTLFWLGAGLTAVAVPISVALVQPYESEWGAVSIVVIVALPFLTGTLIVVVFASYVVSSMQRLLEKRSQIVISEELVRSADAELAERVRLAQLSARAVPFLETVVASGEISPTDRNLAGQIARRLRDDLVTQANTSWLDGGEIGSRLVVIDPDRRADRLRPSQRTALRALVRALLEEPVIDQSSIMVELRGRPDGATAVGVSVDLELPEGRRIMHLAPYYLTLKMTAEDLVWDQGDVLRLSFQFPPER